MKLTTKQQALFHFIREAHEGQERKGSGEDYWRHPFRVAYIIWHADNKNFRHSVGIEVALLHDVVEDNPDITYESLMATMINIGYTMEQSKTTIRFVEQLTNTYTSEAYPHMNRAERKKKEACRLSQISSFSQSIKYADMLDNLNDEPIPDRDFLEVYYQEMVDKLDMMRKGDIHLYMQVCRQLQNRINEELI